MSNTFATVHETPVYRAHARSGLAKYWRGRILAASSGQHYLQTEWWQQTGSGESAVQVSQPALVEPKNVGRRNATTPAQQARLELDAMVLRQRDDQYRLLSEPSYRDEQASGAARPLPMLAHSYEKRGHAIQWPARVQPKLDGCRCLSDGTHFWSRQGKDFHPAVVAHLQFDARGNVVDGELILPPEAVPAGMDPFQTTMKAIKKFDPVLSPQLTYQVYDMVVEGDDAEFSERHFEVEDIVAHAGVIGNVAGLRLVETVLAENEDEMMRLHAHYVARGFEGTMVRDDSGGYEVGQRATQLQKVKDFVDGEFEVVGVLDGKGKEAGLALFECRTPEGRTFVARPRGDAATRAAWYQRRADLIGARRTVRYQNLSEEGVPRFPVGVSLREDFD